MLIDEAEAWTGYCDIHAGHSQKKKLFEQLRKPFVEYTTAWRAVQADARNKAKWDSVMNWLSFGTPGKEQVADENS